MKVGINLYSLRKQIATEQDFLATALRLKEMGYASLQFSGAPFDAEMIGRVSRESGLPVTLTHVPLERILSDPEQLAKEHLFFGCKRVGLGMMPLEAFVDEEKCTALIAQLECAAKRLKENGVTLFCHNHHFEFYRFGQKTVFDLLLEDAPDVHFTADVYWLQYGGVNVAEFFKKLAGRVECVHLKDYRIVRKKSEKIELIPAFAPVGDGSLDIPAIVRAAKAAGAEEFYVEQDDACDYPDPFERVGRSVRYLNALREEE